MRRALALLVLAVALAAPATAGAAIDAATVAAALERSPLYVDPSYDDVVTPADRRRVLAAIRARPEPVYVAVVPLRDGDRYNGEERAFLTALQARVRDSDALFVALAEYSPYTASADRELDERGDLATRLVRAQLPYDAPIVDQLTGLVEALGLDDLEGRVERAEAREQARREAEASATPAPAATAASEDAEGGGGVPVWLVVVGAALLLAVVAGVVLGRRGGPRAGAPGAPPLLPDKVFEHARAARVDELRERTRTEVIALSETIDAAPTPTGGPALAAYERAVEHAAAASKLHDRATRTVELAGVLVLVDGGREALRRAADLAAGARHRDARPLCFFDPLHGRSARDVRWAVREVAACAACAADVKAGRDPQALREDGRPWFEGDGALAATGMGQFADLPSRLARGEDP